MPVPPAPPACPGGIPVAGDHVRIPARSHVSTARLEHGMCAVTRGVSQLLHPGNAVLPAHLPQQMDIHVQLRPVGVPFGTGAQCNALILAFSAVQRRAHDPFDASRIVPDDGGSRRQALARGIEIDKTLWADPRRSTLSLAPAPVGAKGEPPGAQGDSHAAVARLARLEVRIAAGLTTNLLIGARRCASVADVGKISRLAIVEIVPARWVFPGTPERAKRQDIVWAIAPGKIPAPDVAHVVDVVAPCVQVEVEVRREREVSSYTIRNEVLFPGRRAPSGPEYVTPVVGTSLRVPVRIGCPPFGIDDVDRGGPLDWPPGQLEKPFRQARPAPRWFRNPI